MRLLQCRSRGAVLSTQQTRGRDECHPPAGTFQYHCGSSVLASTTSTTRSARMKSRFCTLLHVLVPRGRHAAGCVAMATALALAVVGYGGPATRAPMPPTGTLRPAPLPAGPAPHYI